MRSEVSYEKYETFTEADVAGDENGKGGRRGEVVVSSCTSAHRRFGVSPEVSQIFLGNLTHQAQLL